MIHVIRIQTIEDAQKHLFFHQKYQDSIGRNRTLYVYRGLPDVRYQLITSLQRNCKSRKRELEESILDSFAKYAELESPTVTQSVWRKMILGQHHGLPTRLLDWSRSPLMALHFAMTESNMDLMDQRDCVMWRLNVEKMNAVLPQKYKDELQAAKQKVFSVDMLQHVCGDLATYDADMKGTAMVMMEPPTIDMRIANQYSYFSIVPSDVSIVEDMLEKCDDGVTKYIIDKNLRWEIRDMLDQANISERIVYPGLDGIATWLGRHHFVRDLSRLQIECMSIADLEADVIVNPSNRTLTAYHGVNAAIFHKAGKQELTQACSACGLQKPGGIAVTPAFGLNADYIYHTVVPLWDDHREDELKQQLHNLYTGALVKLKQTDLHSIGFPLLGAGSMHTPQVLAWQVALDACRTFCRENPGYPLKITFCVIDAAVQKLGRDVLDMMNGKISRIADDYLYIGYDRKA